MSKFPICGECKRPFDGDVRKPRLLPCGHASCTACLSSMEDRDSTLCPEKKCRKDWSNRCLSDLPIVYDLIPESSGRNGGERYVTPASAESSRNVIPAPRASAPRPTGREVVPLEESERGSPTPSLSSTTTVENSGFPTCAVCLDDFNATDGRPLLLPCGHVSCFACLDTLERNGDLSCPRCRQVRTRGLIRQLPVVLSLIDPKNAKKNSNRAVTSADVLARARDLQRDYMQRGQTSPDNSDPKKMEIFVKDIRGQIHTFRLNPHTETVLQLRQRLPSPVDSCRYLTFQGRTMENNCMLAQYNVRPHCTIEERGRLQGGATPTAGLQG